MASRENARTTPLGRRLMVRRLAEGQSVGAVAAPKGCATDPPGRFAARGACPPETTAQIEAPRRQRWSGPAIARELGLAGSTVGLVPRRLGLNSLKALDPKPEIIRDEREHPGKLIRIDIKKLGRIDSVGHRITGDRHGQIGKRGSGWEYLHIAIDDASRLAFTAMMPDEKPDEKKESAVAFLDAAIAWFAAHGLKHGRTRPSTPKTIGKAERSSRPASANGPMARLCGPPRSAPARCTHGCTPITPPNLTQPSRESPPSAASRGAMPLAMTHSSGCGGSSRKRRSGPPTTRPRPASAPPSETS
jgi:hypothetical protein